MAASVTITEITACSVKKIIFDWTADSDGNASDTTDSAYDGELIALATVPDGDTPPSDNYDATLTDANGHDVLINGGLNRDTSNTEIVKRADLGAVSGSKLTFNISGAGSGGKGVAVVWLR